MNEKERTDKIYNPKYQVEKNFFVKPSRQFDKSDWEFRKFRKYDNFTKTFDNKIDW